MLTERELEEFVQTGLVRVPNVLSQEDARQIRADLWLYLATEYGIDEHDRATWSAIRIPSFKGLTRSAAFARVGVGAVPAALDLVIGTDWQPPKTWAGMPMVTFPMPGVMWDVPSDGWHCDRPYDADDRPGAPGVQVFVFVNDVRPLGGGTIVLTGSHRLVARYASESSVTLHAQAVKSALRAQDPWLKHLLSPIDQPDRIRCFMDDGARIDGVDLRVAELTGAAGDAILMDARTLHTIAPNCLDTPRMMLNHLISRPDADRGDRPAGHQPTISPTQR